MHLFYFNCAVWTIGELLKPPQKNWLKINFEKVSLPKEGHQKGKTYYSETGMNFLTEGLCPV